MFYKFIIFQWKIRSKFKTQSFFKCEQESGDMKHIRSDSNIIVSKQIICYERCLLKYCLEETTRLNI